MWVTLLGSFTYTTRICAVVYIAFFVSPLSTPLQMVIAASCVRAHSFLTQGSAGRHLHNTARRIAESQWSCSLIMNLFVYATRGIVASRERCLCYMCWSTYSSHCLCRVRERVYTILINYRLNVCHQFKAAAARCIMCVRCMCASANTHTAFLMNRRAYLSDGAARCKHRARPGALFQEQLIRTWGVSEDKLMAKNQDSYQHGGGSIT